jgi:hypothetical protein
MQRWGKTPVIASDIGVHRQLIATVLRRGIRLLEEGVADANDRPAMSSWADFAWAVRAHGLHWQRRELRRHLLGVRGAVLRPRYKPSITQPSRPNRDFSAKRRSEAITTIVYRRHRLGTDPATATLVFERVLAMLINER